MSGSRTKKLTTLAFAAMVSAVLAIGLAPALAQKHGAGGHGGGESGCSSGGCGDSSHSDSEGGCESGGGCGGGGGKGSHGQRGGHHTGQGGRGQSLRDIFHGLDMPSITERGGSAEHGASQ
jgi:hypothetical protein